MLQAASERTSSQLLEIKKINFTRYSIYLQNGSLDIVSLVHTFYQHVKQECENSSSNISSCDKSHPIVCRFFLNIGRCKSSPCSYKHERSPSNAALENKNHDFEKEMKQELMSVSLKILLLILWKVKKTINKIVENLTNIYFPPWGKWRTVQFVLNFYICFFFNQFEFEI